MPTRCCCRGWTFYWRFLTDDVVRLPFLRRHLAGDPRHDLPDARRDALRRADGRRSRPSTWSNTPGKGAWSACCGRSSARWPACRASCSACSGWRSSSTRCTCRQSKSVLAGSMTLALLILPTVIRASEEAIRAVPAHLQGGGAEPRGEQVAHGADGDPAGGAAGHSDRHRHQHGPGGRRDGADHLHRRGQRRQAALALWETLAQPTPALPWNIYNLATEHEAVDEIRHVQYGMVLTLVLLVLLLNLAAIVMRARIIEEAAEHDRRHASHSPLSERRDAPATREAAPPAAPSRAHVARRGLLRLLRHERGGQEGHASRSPPGRSPPSSAPAAAARARFCGRSTA